MAIDDVLVKAVRIVEERIQGFRGAYLAGSRGSGSLIRDTADVDIHIVVDTAKLGCKHRISYNRYGCMVHIEGFDRTVVLSDGIHEYLVDYFLLPESLFSQSDRLLRSHDLFAASSNLYSSKQFVDPYGLIQTQKTIVRKNFMRPDLITARIKFVAQLSRQKLDEFGDDLVRGLGKVDAKTLWDGPIWALSNATILPLTRYGVTPTFIRSLAVARGLLLDAYQEAVYERFIQSYGLRKLGESEVTGAIEAIADANRALNEGIPRDENYIVNRLRTEYWMETFAHFADIGEIDAMRSAVCYVACQIACFLERKD